MVGEEDGWVHGPGEGHLAIYHHGKGLDGTLVEEHVDGSSAFHGDGVSVGLTHGLAMDGCHHTIVHHTGTHGLE